MEKTTMILSTPLPINIISIILIFCICRVPFPTPAFSDPSDESCLSALLASLSDPSGNLRNWTRPNMASPCNGITSYIAGAVCNNDRIFKLSLPGLSLSGSIPPLISNCTGLQSLDLSSNRLSGPIPPQISSLLNLALLNLSSNLLSSPIPPDLSLNAYLNVIDLHSNDLSGEIPEQLASLARLAVLDLSENRLEGMVPVGLGRRFNESAFRGNDDLYGFPLKNTGRMGDKGLSVWGIVGIGLASGVLSLMVSFTAVCIWLRVTETRNGGDGGGGGDDGGKISHYMPEY